MNLTTPQKIEAISEAYTARMEALRIYSTLADAGEEHAKKERRRVRRELRLLRSEGTRLKAELVGTLDPAAEEAARFHEAVEHTRRIEAEFRQDLARMGHPQQTSSAMKREIEERALGHVRESHGEHAAEHCRHMLEPRGTTATVTGASAPFPPA